MDNLIEYLRTFMKIKKQIKKMSNSLNRLLVIIYCIIPLFLNAQNFRAEAKVDSNHILIGDHLTFQLSFTGDKYTKVLFPPISDTCFKGIEIIERSIIGVDTNNQNVVFRQKFILTSYDSGYYTIPALSFYDFDSVLLGETNPIHIHVNTLAVDTAAAIKDIKRPLRVPLTLGEILPYVLLFLASALIIGLGIWFIIRLRNKKPILPKLKEKEKIPAHIIALNALESLRLKKLWQQGEYKLYYSELSEIFRMYIENRWNIQAMEMVSDEIIQSLMQQNIETEHINNIQFTLHLADMVKFAKGQPLPDENQKAFNHVLNFVNATKVLEEQIDKKAEA